MLPLRYQEGCSTMAFRADHAPEEDEPELVGLRISAGLLAGVGCIFAIYPLGFAVLLIVLAIQVLTGQASIFRPQSWLLMLVGMCVSAAITYLLFYAASALGKRQLWAAYLAMLFGVMFLLLSGVFVYDLYHPERAGPDEGYGIFFIPFCFLIGLWWCVYLNLPHVRRQLKRP
jgi:hypothetical protein